MAVPPVEPGLIARWMAHQRWFADKGALPALEEIGRFEFTSPLPGVEICTHMLLDHAEGKPVLYQVPLTYRSKPLPGAEAAMVGMIGTSYIYDAPHDPVYTAALLAVIDSEQEIRGDRTWAKGVRAARRVAAGLRSRVLSGEQSNTSIVFEPTGDGDPVICKLFRALHHGANPDVELQTALAAAGFDAVPRSVGQLVADWSDRGRPTGRARGDLAFAQEYLVGAHDAWRLARDAAEAGRDFAVEARAMGVATAGLHATLAGTMPTAPAGTVEIETALEQMRGRLAAAIAVVPDISRYAASIGAMLEATRSARWPAQQRIHGDLHLGQVLSVPGRGWMFIDFEGEPLRPMPERSRLDNPLRDVASMLRSFDYVVGSLAVQDRSAPADWALSARGGFERGYAETSGCDVGGSRALIDALELDKALYEVVYESRNRPTWIRIPAESIERIVERSSASRHGAVAI